MEKRGKGWVSGEELIADVEAYLDKCKAEGRFANIEDFCVFVETTRNVK